MILSSRREVYHGIEADTPLSAKWTALFRSRRGGAAGAGPGACLLYTSQVDYIITHCAPTSIALMGSRHNEADRLTDFLQEVQERAKYHYWLFGHYHDNKAIDEKHILLWEQIVQIPVSYTHLDVYKRQH